MSLKIFLVSLLLLSFSYIQSDASAIEVYDPIERRELEDVEAFIGLPKIKTSLTENDKKAMIDGAKAAASFFKFLVEKDFFSTLTKISSVAGPIFSIASTIISIAFMFIEIESPEMALMKKEFANINNRIDKWSVEFSEIKRKIDWSAVQVNFAEIENSIISLTKLLVSLPEVPQEMRETQTLRFLNKYEIDYKASGEMLYVAMINIDQIFSSNLFKAAQKYFENNRKLVQEFMMSTMTLLTQAIQLEASYVKIKYDDENASQFTQSLWSKRLETLKEKMEAMDLETKNNYKTQYEIDLDNLLKINAGVKNEQFVTAAYQFFADKYDWRDWFVLCYGEVSGFKDHTVSTCEGTHRFRSYGRNIIISSVDKVNGDAALAHKGYNNDVSGSYNNWNSDREYSRSWVNYIRSRLPNCNQADTVASVAWGSDVWFMNTRLVVYKKNCVYGRDPCYNTFIFA